MARHANPNRREIRPAGMPCPRCAHPIIIDPMLLLSAAPIQCGACQLELKVNVEESAATLNALKTYMDTFEKIEAGLADAADMAPIEPRAPRGRRRRERSRIRGSA